MVHAKINSTVEETPSQKVIKKGARKTFEVIDDLGRILKVRTPSYLERTDFIAALGDRAQLEKYVEEVSPAMYVREIDGMDVSFPARLSEVRAIIQKLDNEGVQAIIQCVIENILGDLKDKEVEEINKEEKEKIKK